MEPTHRDDEPGIAPGSVKGGQLKSADEMRREIEALWARISRLSAAILRINGSLDVRTALCEVVESARALPGARYGVITTLVNVWLRFKLGRCRGPPDSHLYRTPNRLPHGQAQRLVRALPFRLKRPGFSLRQYAILKP